MGVQFKPDSIKNGPKSAEELTEENKVLNAKVARLEEQKASLEAQVTDLQLALCDVYEQFDAMATAAAETGGGK